VADADGTADASVPIAGAPVAGVASLAGSADPVADGGAAGAKITVGAIVTMGRTPTVTRRESSGVHARALAR